MAEAKGSKPSKKTMLEDTESGPTPSTAQTLLSYGVKPYTPAENEDYMSKSQKEHFRNLLNIWKNALMQGGDETIDELKKMAGAHADPNDQASLEETLSFELRARDREHKLIEKIDDSIKLIDSGDYGYCDECGIEIGIRRLEARPTATLCIDCKTLAEVREKQGRN